MKEYQKPAFAAINVDVENAIIGGSAPSSEPQMPQINNNYNQGNIDLAPKAGRPFVD